MANMSYCRFQNTAMDFRDCLNTVQDAIDEGKSFQDFYGKMSREEQAAFNRLLVYAQDFIYSVEEIREAESEGTLYDNEMDA